MSISCIKYHYYVHKETNYEGAETVNGILEIKEDDSIFEYMKPKLIFAIVFSMLPVFYIIYAVIAESIKERRERREAKEKGITIDDTGKPKYTYSFWSVLSGIFLIIPMLIYEAFKRNKRY